MKDDSCACQGDTKHPGESEELGRGPVGEEREGIKADGHPRERSVCVSG